MVLGDFTLAAIAGAEDFAETCKALSLTPWFGSAHKPGVAGMSELSTYDTK